MKDIGINKNYLDTLEAIKTKIKTAQIKAHLSVNKEMLILYWQIGKTILEKQEQEDWGTKVLDRISKDLILEFPQISGFSKRNLEFMQQFARTYNEIIPIQLVSELPLPPIFLIPWGHNICLMQKLDNLKIRIWYAKKTIENGWSRNVLVHQISTKLYERQSKNELKTNNFEMTLPEEQSDLACEIFKDEYNLEFIDNAHGTLKESALEKALVDDVVQFLMELGKGFAFIGKQYHLEIAGDDFYIDLLFYHIKLKSYIVIELKTNGFKPEYAGEMGFYLACVDDFLKDENDNDSIGIILCQDTKKEVKEKSLRYMMKPIGVSNYTLSSMDDIPKELEETKKLEGLI